MLPLDGSETTYFNFSWGMLPKLMKESVRLISAVKHWHNQMSLMQQQSRDECASIYMSLRPTNTREYGCQQVMRKRWSRVCNCCEVKGAPKNKLPSHIVEKVAEWRGCPYVRNENEKKMVASVDKGLCHYGDEDYF